ncbi:hypothetical protein LP7551_04179 [Roseibium album]|nr:hypothetical protein LP7551_04179 [Roseibium album]
MHVFASIVTDILYPKVCILIIHNATIGYMYCLFVFYFIVHFTSEGVYYEG